MPLTDLPSALQTIEVYNFEMFLRVIWIVMVIGFSSLYLFYFLPRQKSTESIAVGFMRLCFTIFSFVNIITIPLIFFGMSPQIEVWDFVIIYFVFYTSLFGVYVLATLADFWRFGIPLLLRIANIDMKDKKTNKLYLKYRRLLEKYGY